MKVTSFSTQTSCMIRIDFGRLLITIFFIVVLVLMVSHSKGEHFNSHEALIMNFNIKLNSWDPCQTGEVVLKKI